MIPNAFILYLFSDFPDDVAQLFLLFLADSELPYVLT